MKLWERSKQSVHASRIRSAGQCQWEYIHHQCKSCFDGQPRFMRVMWPIQCALRCFEKLAWGFGMGNASTLVSRLSCQIVCCAAAIFSNLVELGCERRYSVVCAVVRYHNGMSTAEQKAANSIHGIPRKKPVLLER